MDRSSSLIFSLGVAGLILCSLHQIERKFGLLSLVPRRLHATASAPIVLLTRDAHKDGRWLTDLQAALLNQGSKVVVLPLSQFRGASLQWRCLVNRVSDAAPPDEAKTCVAAMRGAELLGLPCINGVSAYALGCSKLNHYQLFHRASVRTPPFTVLRRGNDSPSSAAAAAYNEQLRFPLILKPNAGGFGVGVSLISDEEELSSCESKLEAAFGADGLALLQEFAQPDGGWTFRVFFLGSTVQCAVKTRAPAFNACLRNPALTVEPWEPPAHVAASVIQMGRLAEADCGSVELLFCNGEPLYFDFNLLSTLPTPEQCGRAQPYRDLAEHVLSCSRRRAWQ